MRHSAFIYETDLHLLLIYQCHVGVRRARSEGGTRARFMDLALCSWSLQPNTVAPGHPHKQPQRASVGCRCSAAPSRSIPRKAIDSEYEDDSESEAEIVGEPEDEMSESEGE